MHSYQRLSHYAQLIRIDKPIGVLLLLWPTLWALWLAGNGHPDPYITLVFLAGVFLMRSAGCAVNDFADRHVDAHVARTRLRPLAAGHLHPMEALVIAGLFAFIALLLVLSLNTFTIQLAFIGALLAFCYPFLKRYTHLPQLGLGAAFSWGIPMAFAAEINEVTPAAWLLFITAVIWPVIYDTLYAMVDRADDEKIGVKSTAILFNHVDKMMIGLLQVIFLILLIITGLSFKLHVIYYISLLFVAGLFVYQQWLIKDRDTVLCFQAFKNNNWVGLFIFAGIFLSYSI